MNIGEKISTKRKELGLTLEQVGDFVGVSKSTVKKWETGYISNMRRDKIAMLAKILQLEPTEFITEPETENNIVLGSELKQLILNISIELNEDYEKLVNIYLNNKFPRELNYNSLIYFYSCYLGLPLYISKDNSLSQKQKIIMGELKSLDEDDLERVNKYIEKIKEIRSLENLSTDKK